MYFLFIIYYYTPRALCMQAGAHSPHHTPCPRIIILNYENCMSNFFFSLSIFWDTGVLYIRASLELTIYVSQAGLNTLSVLSVSPWSVGIAMLWTTTLGWSEHKIHKLLGDLSSEGLSYKFMVRKRQKPKGQHQNSNRTRKKTLIFGKFWKSKIWTTREETIFLFLRYLSPDLLLIFMYFYQWTWALPEYLKDYLWS